MNTKDDGGPAFPVSTSDANAGHQDSSRTWQFPGLSLRDYFAAKAMHGLILNSQGTQGHDMALIQSTGAELAYEFADSMLKARAL